MNAQLVCPFKANLASITILINLRLYTLNIVIKIYEYFHSNSWISRFSPCGCSSTRE